MNSTSNGPHFRWQVHLAKSIAQSVYKLQATAADQGRGEQARAAFHAIVDRLKSDPTEFGEPLYRLPTMRLSVRSAAIIPVVVHFAVSEEYPLVFIRAVKLMSL